MLLSIQAMYVVHINYTPDTETRTTPFTDPFDALMGMFYMSMGKLCSQLLYTAV